MLKDLCKNIFAIRIPVKTSEKIVLGMIPILLIFFLWIAVTTGRKETIVLPAGTFSGHEESMPKFGTSFPDGVRLTIDNAEIKYSSNEDEKPVTELIKDGRKYNITFFGNRPMGNSVRLTLDPGVLLPAPKKAQTSNEETNQASEQTSAGTVDLSAASPTSQVAQESTDSADNDFIAYRYEVVESRIFSPTTLPSPWETFRSLPQLWTQRNLLTNILYSFLRVGAGFLVAFVIVFPISLLMGTFTKFHAFFSPLMLFGAYLPIPALVPLTMCFFGTNEEQKVMFLALGFAIYLLPLFVQALEEVDNVYLQTGYTLGATKFQVLNKIMLPIALPKIYDAMRLGFGIGWGYIILAEMVDMGSKGVGALILISQRRGPREDIYLVLIAIVVMAFITDKIWEKIGDRLFPYRSQER